MARISKIEIIRLQKTKGATDHEIGAYFHVTRQAVHQLRKKYGIPVVEGRHDKRNEHIYHHYLNGVEVEKIAEACNISVSQAYRAIKKIGSQPKQKKQTRR